MRISRIFFFIFFLSMNVSMAQSQQPLIDSGIYETTMQQIHNCLQSAKGKDSLERRYHCYQQVLVENYEELKRYGVDTLKDAGFKKYYPLYLKRFQKSKEGRTNLPIRDESFLGGFVTQRKLSDGSYTITLLSKSENKTMVFIGDKPLEEKELALLPKNKDNIIIAYHTEMKNDTVMRVVKSVVFLR